MPMRPARLTTVLASIAFATLLPSAARAQDGIVAKGTQKGGGLPTITLRAANSSATEVGSRVESLALDDGRRLTPTTSTALRLAPQTTVTPWSLGGNVSVGAGQVADLARATSAVLRLRDTRAGSTDCVVRVPATYKPTSLTLELQAGDVARFFDASGRAIAARCTTS